MILERQVLNRHSANMNSYSANLPRVMDTTKSQRAQHSDSTSPVHPVVSHRLGDPQKVLKEGVWVDTRRRLPH